MASYFDLTRYLSYNALLTFVIGFRSAGKTYAFKDWALHSFIESGAEFVYLRRYQVETDATKNTLFTDIEEKYNLDIKCEGDTFYCREHFDEDDAKYVDENGKEQKAEPEPWQRCGYALSLTSFAKYKSASFAKVDKICFDEFLIENPNSHYLKNEVVTLASLYHTIARRNRVRLVAFANSSDMLNPYFENYHIRLSEFKRSKTIYRNDKTVLFVYYKNEAAQKELLQSEQGKAFGEAFNDYAFRGDFLGDDNVNVLPKFGEYQCNLTNGDLTVGIYSKGSRLWISNKGRGGVTFTTAGDDLQHPLSPPMLAWVKSAVQHSTVFFESAGAKARFLEIMNL